jgi:3-oxoacyl-[acyl-carrier-protein] synthase-3
MVTKTRELLMAGMELAVRTWGRAAEALGWTADAIDHFVVHQVSKVHTEQFAGILGIDLKKVFRLYPEFGNVGPAGVPIALSKLLESGKLHRGQRVAILGIGSGINCTMAELLW